MVSNIYLNEMCKNLKNYQGTFSCNTIKSPNYISTNETYIINLSKENEKGSHLIAIQLNAQDKKIKYFDSFGIPCSNEEILTFISRINTKYEYNSKQIQHFKSIHCGMFCLAFVKYHDNNSNSTNFLKMFKTVDLFKNDNIVVNYISQNAKLIL